MTTNLYVFAERPSPRLQYVLLVLLEQLSGISVQIVHHAKTYRSMAGPKLNYSPARLSNEEVHLIPAELLFQRDVQPQQTDVFQHGELPVFFGTSDVRSDLPYDPLAMCFFLLSRYEEYLPFQADQHGRFPAAASLAFRAGFLQQPLVDLMARQLRDLLQRQFPDLTFRTPSFRYTPTYDVDLPWAYLHRHWSRIAAGLTSDLFRGRQHSLRERLQVLTGKKADPFFTFPWLEELHRRSGLHPIYFFPTGPYGRYDKNPAASHPEFAKLVRTLARHNRVGLHPSYRSSTEGKWLEVEKRRLEKLTGRAIGRSRQHFLRLRFPETYRQLLAAGIREDHTLGYAETPGFRASIARPFPWYDLLEERITELTIVPFQIMDVTLRQYQGLSTAEAWQSCLPLIEHSRKVDGHLITLWHNNSLSDEGAWLGWRDFYAELAQWCRRLKKDDVP